MAVDPISAGFTLLYGTLSGDATLMALLAGGLWKYMAPPGSTPDYGLIANQSAPDTNSAIGSRILSRMLFQVKFVGPTQDDANLRAAFARADALLQPSGQPLRNQSGTLACFRESSLQLAEPQLINGVQWVNIGGIYRVEA